LTWVKRKHDFRFLGLNGARFLKELNENVAVDRAFEAVQWGRRNGLELIRITRSKKLMASDPQESLPSGHYLKFESVEDPAEYLLFSRKGKVYRVKRQDLKDAIEQGYVKA
jgi:hypothetical protein